MNNRRLKVLLTVDTELTPGLGVGTPAQIKANLGSSIYGTPAGQYGVPFQLQCLREHDLKAVFFVESLSPVATGLSPLREVVDLIQDAKQEVQLHVHSEWIKFARVNPLGDHVGQNMHDFPRAEQTRMIELALAYLKDSGAPRVNAFRAGNYGANNDTLKALAENGIRMDSSYNYPYLGRTCRIDAQRMLTQPKFIGDVWEVPVSFFSDRPGGYRHAQLCACSFREISNMLLRAHALGADTFVIVSHSFELINQARTKGNGIVVSRFRRLCQFLSQRRDIFVTVGFNDLVPHDSTQHPPLASSLWRTAERQLQQAVSRIYE